jgi:hypothetical protein
MARATDALSAGANDYADRRQSYDAAPVRLGRGPFSPSDVGAGPLSAPVEHAGSHARPGVDSRAIRGIVLAVALSVPLWVAIVMGAAWVFR